MFKFVCKFNYYVELKLRLDYIILGFRLILMNWIWCIFNFIFYRGGWKNMKGINKELVI